MLFDKNPYKFSYLPTNAIVSIYIHKPIRLVGANSKEKCGFIGLPGDWNVAFSMAYFRDSALNGHNR